MLSRIAQRRHAEVSRAPVMGGGLIWACGLAVGLALARLVAEASRQPWRVAQLALIVGAGLVTGIVAALAIGELARRRTGELVLWPLGALFVYVLWPVPAFWWGAGLLIVVALAMTALNATRPAGRWLSLAALVAALALYATTCSRSALAADAGEFQIVTNVLGIAHPPGYALYTMLGRLAALLPLGSPAYRINLLSGVTSALALYVGAELVRRETDSMIAGLVFAAGLGLSATFWVQSTTANIRSLLVLLLVLCVDALFRWRRDPSTQRLAWVGLTFGLGAGHHSSVLLLAPAVLAFLLACEPGLLRSPRRWLSPLGAFAASLLVWLYLPIRSAVGSPFDPEPITSLRAFVEHVLALGFRGDMLHFRTLPALAERLDVFGQILRLEFGWPLVLGCAAGAILLARRDWRALLLLGGVWLLNAASALTYRAPQTVEYLLPSYASMLLVLAIGLGGWRAEGWLRDVRAVALSALLVVALGNGCSNWGSLQVLAQDSTDQQYAESLLNAAPQDALVLSNWHHATTMWYLQTVEGLRPDVDVAYVYPEGSTPNKEVWLRRIDAGLATRPVVVTNWFYGYESSGYRFLPLAEAWQVFDGEGCAIPQDAEAMDLTFDQGMRLVAAVVRDGNARPGGDVRVRIYWEALRTLEHDYAGFVQLVGPGGVLGQGDVSHRAGLIAPGVLQVDSHDLSLLWHAQPGSYQLIAGFYFLGETGAWQRCTSAGADHVVLGQVEVSAAHRSPASLHPKHIVFADGIMLMGYDYDRGVQGQTRVYLHVEREGPSGHEDRSDALQAMLLLDGVPVASGILPALVPGQAATVAMDLAGSPEALDLALETTDGARVPWGGAWHLRQRGELRLRLPDPSRRYVPMGGSVAYAGLTVADGRQGEPALSSEWLALRPLVRDYAVSVGVRSGASELKADGTPAMGAIPTLKWLQGWQVRDERSPEFGLTGPEAVVGYSVEMYDAFTLAPLQVLDERLVREGQGTRILEPATAP